MNFKFEIPYCYVCSIHHMEGEHPDEQFEPQAQRVYYSTTSSSSSSATGSARITINVVVADLELKQSLELLGLPRDAGKDAIRKAFRRKIAAVHPDHGGSAHETRLVLIARDVLKKRGLM